MVAPHDECFQHLTRFAAYDPNRSQFRVLASRDCRVRPLPRDEHALGSGSLLLLGDSVDWGAMRDLCAEYDGVSTKLRYTNDGGAGLDQPGSRSFKLFRRLRNFTAAGGEYCTIGSFTFASFVSNAITHPQWPPWHGISIAQYTRPPMHELATERVLFDATRLSAVASAEGPTVVVVQSYNWDCSAWLQAELNAGQRLAPDADRWVRLDRHVRVWGEALGLYLDAVRHAFPRATLLWRSRVTHTVRPGLRWLCASFVAGLLAPAT